MRLVPQNPDKKMRNQGKPKGLKRAFAEAMCESLPKAGAKPDAPKQPSNPGRDSGRPSRAPLHHVEHSKTLGGGRNVMQNPRSLRALLPQGPGGEPRNSSHVESPDIPEMGGRLPAEPNSGYLPHTTRIR